MDLGTHEAAVAREREPRLLFAAAALLLDESQVRVVGRHAWAHNKTPHSDQPFHTVGHTARTHRQLDDLRHRLDD